MIYQHLDPSYKYDVVADNLHARETEHFHYWFDLANFKQISSATNDEAYKADLLKRCGEITGQMQRVEEVINALQSHIDDAEAFSAACARAKQRRADAVRQ